MGGRQTLHQMNEVVDEIREKQSSHQLSMLQHKILNWLTPTDYSTQHSDFNSRRQHGTGQWLLDSDPFRTWLNEPGKTMFCPGIPGAGKTILASSVINHVFDTFEDRRKYGVAYVYGNFRRQGDQTPLDLLLSLLRQFLQYLDVVPESVLAAYRASEGKGRPLLAEVTRMIHQTLSHYIRGFVIIDAIDECRAQDPACRGLLAELSGIQVNAQMNLFVTSRFIPEITDYFTGRTGSLSLEIWADEDDVRKYLEGHMTQLPSFVTRNTDLQMQIVNEIAQSIEGM